MLVQTVALSMLVGVSGWVVPSTVGACTARGAAASQSARYAPVCMEEAAPAAADFTEDLLDALTTDDMEDLLDALTTDDDAVVEEPAQFYKPASGAQELEPLPSYPNAQSVEAIRAKYKLHEKDSGSAQVQIAVLTARIAYLTKHMESNRKDYSSLRGLTAMVTRRRKLLEYLLKEDLGEFKRLTSELGIRTNQLLKPKLSGARGRRV